MRSFQKFYVALLGGLSSWYATVSGRISTHEWVGLGIAVLTAGAVLVTPNKPSE